MKLKDCFDDAKCFGSFCAPFLALGVASVTVLPPVVDGVMKVGHYGYEKTCEGLDYVGKVIVQKTFDPY